LKKQIGENVMYVASDLNSEWGKGWGIHQEKNLEKNEIAIPNVLNWNKLHISLIMIWLPGSDDDCWSGYVTYGRHDNGRKTNYDAVFGCKLQYLILRTIW
jgi:hypothetical protein